MPYGTGLAALLSGLSRQPIMGGQERQRIPTPAPRSLADGGLMGGQMPPQNPMPQMQMPQGMPQGLGNSSRSIFDAYMSQAFNQIHKPPEIPGIYGQQPGGYSGFFGRQLPKLPQAPQQQPIMGGQIPPQLVGNYGMPGIPENINWSQYLNAGS
jgi:hypothetical protein